MNRTAMRICCLVGVIMLITSSMLRTEVMDDGINSSIEATEGRQLTDIDCSNYTFEDLFAYNHAHFSIELLDDWASATTTATAWVNGSLSADVRDDIDGLFEGLSGGNNDWLSTDERELVRNAGPQCISDMDTRLGLKEGYPHRGGVDWNDLTWVEDGIALDEVNLVPEGHAQERNCQNLGSTNGCKEVPVEITDDLQIHLLQDSSEPNNMELNQLPNMGTEPFTLALNVTNMSDATLELTFPEIDGLRILDYEVLEDGVTDEDATGPVFETLENGKMLVTMEVDYDLADWPMGKELFIDFTTATPPPDTPPEWSDAAPADNGILPMLVDSGKVLLADSTTIQSWIMGDAAVGYDCTADNGWQWEMSMGEMFVTPGSGDTSELTCTPEWIEGQNSPGENRTWTLLQPLVFAATSGEYMDDVPITISSNDGDQSGLSIVITPVQGEASGTAVSLNGPNDPIVALVNISTLSPGPVLLDVVVSGPEVNDWKLMLDLGIKKESRAPQISISKSRTGDNGTWDEDGYSYSMSGTIHDPDGDEVSFEISVCGYSTSITPDGATWSHDVSVVGCTDHSAYVITLTAVDEWSKSSSMNVDVLPLGEDEKAPVSAPKTTSSDDEGLPGPGLIPTMVVILLAGILIQQKRRVQ